MIEIHCYQFPTIAIFLGCHHDDEFRIVQLKHFIASIDIVHRNEAHAGYDYIFKNKSNYLRRTAGVFRNKDF